MALMLLLVGCQAPSLSPPVPAPTFGVRVSDTVPLEAPVAQPPAPGVEEPTAPHVPDEVLAQVAPGADVLALAREVGAVPEGEVDVSRRWVRLRLASESVATAMASLSARPDVLGVSPNWRVQPQYLSSQDTVNDPLYDRQWSHRATRMESAWRKLGPQFSARQVAIAVVDTGCDRTHPDFGDRMLPGRNFTTAHPDPSHALTEDVTDEVGHGTHVAGIAAAGGQDGIGVAGMAWDAAILPVKALDKDGGTLFGIMQGIRWAADYHDSGIAVRVINLSLGSEGYFTSDAAYEDAIRYAWDQGVVVVIAAGNQSGPPIMPAPNPTGLVVSATGAYEAGGLLIGEFLAGFSNRGDRVDVAAPGASIWSTLPRNANLMSEGLGMRTYPVGAPGPYDPPWGPQSGTSMAAPCVSGLVALLAAHYDPSNDRLTADFCDRVVARIKASATDLGPPGKDPYFGWGRIDAAAALTPSSL